MNNVKKRDVDKKLFLEYFNKTYSSRIRILLEDHLNRLCDLNVEIEEILEFERQFFEILEKAKKQIGTNNILRRMKIKNLPLYRAYRYEKLNYLIINFCSLVNAQIGKEGKSIPKNSFLKDMETNFKINPEKEYIRKKFFDESLELTSDDIGVGTGGFNLKREKQDEEEYKRILKKIFPKMQDDLIIKKEDLEYIRELCRNILRKVKFTRDFSCHKYDFHKQEKLVYEEEMLMVAYEFNKLFKEYLDIILEILLVCFNEKRCIELENREHIKRRISSVVDLVIFGNIDNFFHELVESKPFKYEKLRDKFYNSEDILKIMDKKEY